jgi:hypothetical protein
MGGSRADSESHGDLSLADAETVHEDIVHQINKQLVDKLIEENCGPDYVGRVRLTAAPIQDEQKRQLSLLWQALLTDAQFKASLIDSIGEAGVQSLMDRLGLGIQMAEPMTPLAETNQPGDDPQPPESGHNRPDETQTTADNRPQADDDSDESDADDNDDN